MSEERAGTTPVLGVKRGFPIYKTNPSLGEKGDLRLRKRRLGDERKGLILDGGAGEILGQGSAVVYEWEEVDAERFVKLFLAGVKRATDLTKAGLTIFEAVYQEMREHPNTDTIQLSLHGVREVVPKMTDRTYQRGMQELLQKQFLFRSLYDGMFFINVRYMFNGDRLAFVKAYHRKTTRQKTKTVEGQLALAGVA